MILRPSPGLSRWQLRLRPAALYSCPHLLVFLSFPLRLPGPNDLGGFSSRVTPPRGAGPRFQAQVLPFPSVGCKACPRPLSGRLLYLSVGIRLLALCWVLGRFSKFNHLLLSFLHLHPKEQKSQWCVCQKRGLNLGSCKVMAWAQRTPPRGRNRKPVGRHRRGRQEGGRELSRTLSWRSGG